MPFTFRPLSIPDLVMVVPDKFTDDRGYFLETFKASDFRDYGLPASFVQDNFSASKKNVLRGLHYQVEPAAQGKLVSVLRGRAWDVAVDIRPQSPSYLQWEAVVLSAVNGHMLYIPPGFAHGFVALTADTYFVYKCTAQYSQAHERGIRWNDPRIGIQWPVAQPIISERDTQWPLYKD